MKTRLQLLAAMLLFVFVASYAEKPIVSVLGDSYSTYEGLVWPKNNRIWYKAEPNKGNDVTKPEQTWWKILTAEDSPYTLGINNSYSGATICFTGYHPVPAPNETMDIVYDKPLSQSQTKKRL